MNIQIDRISLRNFKGITSLEVNFGQETNIFGDNATGKTTLFDAFLWVLFGKDSLNSTAFEIKALDEQGQEAHNLEHSVEVALSVAGRPMVLRRVFMEKWTKPRGKAKKEFSGHTTDFYIDGVPLKEKDYQGRMKGLIDEGVFRLLTDRRYFNEVLGWKDRREILLTVCGDVSAEEIINGNPDLAGLTNLLSGATVEDAKKIIAAKKKDINESLEKIPTRIDEATKAKVDVRADIGLVPGMIASKEEIKAGLEAKLTDARNGGALSAKRIELNNATAEIQEARNKFNQDMSILLGPLNKDLDGIQAKIRELRARETTSRSTITISQSDIETYERELVRLREEWNAIDGQTINVDCTCPNCGQAIPECQVQAAREKHNAAKAEHLAGIEARGKERAAKIAEYKARIDAANKDLDVIITELAEAAAREAELQKQIAETRAQQPDLSSLESKKAAIQAEIDNITESGQGLVNGIETELWAVQAEIKALTADLNKVDSNKTQDKRIKDLEAEEKKLAAEYEKVEADLFLIEKYIRCKVEALESRINAKFKLARFKMFSDQINGGLQEVCETTLNGVPYSSMNNAGRVQVGLDIIKTLQEHYGIVCPCWIDNRESIVELPDMAGQVISLIVSEPDKTLRIETQPQTKKAA